MHSFYSRLDNQSIDVAYHLLIIHVCKCGKLRTGKLFYSIWADPVLYIIIMHFDALIVDDLPQYENSVMSLGIPAPSFSSYSASLNIMYFMISKANYECNLRPRQADTLAIKKIFIVSYGNDEGAHALGS